MKKLVIMAGVLWIPAVALAQTPQAPEKAEKVRCKRVAETGSVAKVSKVCMTERQWRQQRENSRREADALTTPTGHVNTGG